MSSSNTDRPDDLRIALALVWQAIRQNGADVPDATVEVGAKRTPAEGRYDPARRVVSVPREAVSEGAAAVLGVLLHQAAHAVAKERQLDNTTRESRYHSMVFATLAQELGLDVQQHERLGFSETSPTPKTRAKYETVVARLSAAIEHADNERQAEMPSAARPKRLTIACGCTPPRKALMSPSVLEAGPVLCGVCRKPFAAVDG
ncbi:hypothetical protein CU254_41975 (plasmid) [Amycolatopsis sp. AA4]|uniref:hypothetical protein n=1 Tax=Actinomycetes TaxID=1760 RepID=UPI0001B56C1C|nr:MULTISPECIES: hypothetical protein [Actinomycetes]ATY17148.1 hypothetical protein CU254_41975 [Amycolatopsis sp. AA4]EFL12622.1 hypothetical protein SSMG_08293 [Streptomyces sp. AA4]